MFDLGEGGLLEVLEVHIGGGHNDDNQQSFSKVEQNFYQSCAMTQWITFLKRDGNYFIAV